LRPRVGPAVHPTTTSDLDRIPQYAIPVDASPLDLLLAERAEDNR
jgi:hypothetical protein